MDVRVGDKLQMKKPHPCGANRFDVLRVGMDFKIRCQKCGHVAFPSDPDDFPGIRIRYASNGVG